MSLCTREMALSPLQYCFARSGVNRRVGRRSFRMCVPQFATYKKASKYFSIHLSGSPFKSPQLYSLMKLPDVILARVE
jgi:hypothetical protein